MKRKRRNWRGYHYLTTTREATETWASPVVLPHCAVGGGAPPSPSLREASELESKRASQQVLRQTAHPVPVPGSSPQLQTQNHSKSPGRSKKSHSRAGERRRNGLSLALVRGLLQI